MKYLLLGTVVSTQLLFLKVFAEAPILNCIWLPGCVDADIANPSAPNVSLNIWTALATNVIAQMIQYVAVVAVLALMLSWVMYLVSWWDEEKAKRAKNWIIWSLVWVFISLFAFGMVKLIINFSI